VEEGDREKQVENLEKLEEWLYEEGAEALYTVYHEKEKSLQGVFEKFSRRKVESEEREEFVQKIRKGVQKMQEKVDEWKSSKSWITEDETKDVTDKLTEFLKWFEETLAKQ
jgi:hypothetical protein